MTATASACQIKRNTILNLQGRLKILLFLFFANTGIIFEGKINSCAAFVTLKKTLKMCPVFRKDKTQENLLKGKMLYYCRHGAADLAGLFYLLRLWLCEKWYKCIIKSNTYSLRHRGTEIHNKITQFCLLGNGNYVLLKRQLGRKEISGRCWKKNLFVVIQLGMIFTSAEHLKLHLKSIEAASAQHYSKSSPSGTDEEQRARNLCLR